MARRDAPALRQATAALGLAVLSAGVVAAWLLAFVLARALEYQPHASLWFPPVGITVATLMVLGWRGVPAILVATLLATWLAGLGATGTAAAAEVVRYALIFAVQHLAIWGALAWALQRACRPGRTPGALSRVVTLFLLGGLCAALLSACLGSAGLVATGAIDLRTMVVQSIPWAIGDYAGLLAVGPLVLAAMLRLARRLHVSPEPGTPQVMEMVVPAGAGSRYPAKLSLLLGVSLAVLLLAAALPQQPAVVFALFVVVVIQLWIVHTHGTFHTLIAVVAFSLLIVVATPLLHLGSQALALQFAMISLAANSYFGLAVPGLYADNSRLRHALVRDPVTGALSRAGFVERAHADLRRAEDEGRDAVLLVADMDNLKAINDAQGHAAGDAALRTFVRRCRDRLGPGQLLGRLGGDEFGLYLPDIDASAADTLVETLRDVLATPQSGDDYDGALSASFGLASRQVDGAGLDTLFERADGRMYDDKRSRRSDADSAR